MDPYASIQTIERNSFDLQENLYVRVVGPPSLTNPFTLDVSVSGGACAAVQPIASTLPVIAGSQPTNTSRVTLIVTDSARLPGSPAEVTTALTDLSRLATRADVNGILIDLNGVNFPRVAAANAQADANTGCPSAKNLVATEIKNVLDAYRTANTTAGVTSVEYIVLGGGANVIPFFQTQDVAGLANENEHIPPVAPNSASEAGLKSGLVKGQDFYGSSSTLNIGSRSLSIPDLAVGRLVDGAVDVSAAVNAYVATNGVVVPRSSLITGYDFVGDAAESVKTEVNAGTASTADTLIQAPGQAPTAASAWTAAQLRTKLLAGNHDVVMMSGHFSAGNLLAADYKTTMSAAEIQASTTDLRNMIVLALGCHGGFSIPSSDLLAGASPDPDWAKAFLRKGAAGYVAATGYAYGDTELVEYGERLFVDLAKQMRTGTGPVALGQALVEAKRTYLASTAQVGGIDEKTIVEMSLYGLPMMKVNMPGARLTSPLTPALVTSASPVTAGPGAGFGLSSTVAALNPVVTDTNVTLVNLAGPGSVTTTYGSGRDGTVANPFEPILPKQIDDVTVAGKVLRGVGMRGGTYTDADGVTPLTAAPTTETSRPHLSFNTEVFYPNQTWMPNYYDAVDGGRTRLVTVPRQFRSTSPGATDGTMRTYGQLDLAFYYLPETWTAPTSSAAVKAAAVSPAVNVTGVSASSDGTRVTFNVDAQTDGSAGVQSVWVLYTGTPGSPFHGRWAPVDLTAGSGDSKLWTGSLALNGTDPSTVRFMVQAVNGAGLTTLATNLGAYYTAAPAGPPPTKSTTTITLVSPPSTVTYQTPVSFTAELKSGTTLLANRTIIFDIGGQQAVGTTGADGRATVSITPVVSPGVYTVQASFRGSVNETGSTGSAPFSVVRAATTVTISPASLTVASDQPAGIVAQVRNGSGQALGGKPIVFVITGNSQTIVRTVIADTWGDATLNDTGITAGGTYSVEAYFSGTIPLGNGQTLVQNDEFYESAKSPSAALTITVPDRTPPTITATAAVGTSTPYVAGSWTNQTVTVRFVCDDGASGSGIASCTAPQTVSTEGSTAIVTGTAVDNTGNITTATFGPINIDRVLPTISITSPTSGASYPVGTTVNAAYSCADAPSGNVPGGSGVASCVGAVANGQPIDTATPGPKTLSVMATDAAGNTATSSVSFTASAIITSAAPIVLADMGVSGLQEVGFQTNGVVITGSFTDADGPSPYTASVRWSAGGPFTPFVLNNNSQFVAANVYGSAGTRVVTVKICDKSGQCGTDDVTVRTAITQKMTPILQCVTDRNATASPRYLAKFGYNNPAPFAIYIPTVLSVENGFSTSPYLRGQPQVFLAGNRSGVFETGFSSGSITWRLNAKNVTASPASTRC
jgi:hypothetical protein